MKYCIKKDAKLRLQCLCELCALCGEIKRKQTFNPYKSAFCTHPAAHLYQYATAACARSSHRQWGWRVQVAPLKVGTVNIRYSVEDMPDGLILTAKKLPVATGWTTVVSTEAV